ncbi:MAG: hypothetical protein JWQ00_2915 [Noviherbaspirillum sp.]|nr:hypothetical protein [Noviherbaspirillum sp.]
MTPNIKLAREAVAAELIMAKQGMAYYLSRVEALERALEQLETVGNGQTGSQQQESAKGRKRASAKTESRSKAGQGTREARVFPTTGGDFWLELVTDQPQSAVDIANAAAAALGFARDKAQVQILKQRVSPALNALVDAQKITDSGSGRERRFFRS